MSRDVSDRAPGLIGPNAILQMLPVLARNGGPERARALLDAAGIAEPPSGREMIDEGQAAALHQILREMVPQEAPHLAMEAGHATAEYILANRIPRPAQVALKMLPPNLAARALSRAIARHAWTFAGSGHFRVIDPWCFEIADNPIVRGEVSARPLCQWHAAVFATLYGSLVSRTASCVETACCAQGAPACRFELAH